MAVPEVAHSKGVGQQSLTKGLGTCIVSLDIHLGVALPGNREKEGCRPSHHSCVHLFLPLKFIC